MGVLSYDRKAELTEFDETKTGVKGLVDAEVTEVPRIFLLPSPENLNSDQDVSLPTIDLKGIHEDPIRRKQAMEEVKDALGSWGFFQIVNHGIPVEVLEEMKKGVLAFFEQDSEVRKEWYTRDYSRKVVYNSNFDLYSAPVANWRDSVMCTVYPNPPQPDELPPPCRDILLEYSSKVMKLGCSILELMSESLGLAPNHLLDMGCVEEIQVTGHYYPPCPQPELTIGTTEHTDAGFITILQQDDIGGLKVFYQNQWTDVRPIPGALVVNAGDLLQLVTNDKFVSARHKVIANKDGPRISVASFFLANLKPQQLKVLEPIKELLSEDDPAKYRGTTAKEYLNYFYTKGLDTTSALLHFKK
ncbi:1-aminocyclopropane-1-carboxylate oxidase homolog 1 [Lactuca sativa]|uniref:1-aminocyclopropane-1-carboxylate oxidase homolog 1 n=1 Tax=Lactuca sativa TaxID=4236 RepID=UPI000CC6F1FC|nr:1-aminocyclopropane-1-carboxylate oxidase homolog 1 [Lactuca sativa]